MVNTNWSENVQSIYSLDSSRELRFTEDKLNEIIKATRLENSTNVLEVGCGTGVLTRKLAKRLSKATCITGLDMDSKFISYCKEISEREGLVNLKYIEGSALSIPFEDNTFDACTSHTVIEHVPNKEFLREQYRVCKKGGCVSVMNVRPELAMASQDDIAQSDREKELLARISSVTKESKNELKVGKFFDNPQNIMRLFDEIGFKEIQIDAINYISCIDDYRNSSERKKLMIESEHKNLLEYINMGLSMKHELLTDDERKELISLINNRYMDRTKMVETNTMLWDFNLSPMIVISGRK